MIGMQNIFRSVKKEIERGKRRLLTGEKRKDCMENGEKINLNMKEKEDRKTVNHLF